MTTELRPMNAAEYRANAERKRADRPTEIVTLESGSVFELRRPDLQSYMVMGRLPKSLVEVGVRAWKERQGTAQIGESLTDKDAMDALIFMREIVHDCTINPKFVEFATNNNEIGAEDMLREDFDDIFAWAIGHKGVAGIESLHTFREGRARGTVVDSDNRAEPGSLGAESPESIGPVQ